MRYRTMGRSGVAVSELCLGTMMFGGSTEETEAGRITDHARDHGVNFIDTANAYVGGKSEEVTGRIIAANRQHWVLATKVSNPLGNGPNERGLSRLHILRETEASLRRLACEHIDILYVHKLDPDTHWEETIYAFGDLIRSGKIRYWGLSNVYAWQIADICHLCRQLGVPQPVILQPYYNLMNRQPEVELLPASRQFGLGVASYSPLARGVLSGKYAPGAAPDADTRAGRKDRRMMQSEWREESLVIAQELKAHAEARDITLVDWAVAWVLNNAALTSAIAGPRTFEQWQSYFGALDYTWTAEDEALADRLVPPGHPSSPGFSDPAYPIAGRFPKVA